MKKTSIKDVARHAGVSTATVTRVINNTGYASKSARERVEHSIEMLGYIPNRMASALKSNSTRILGTVFSQSGVNPFFLYIEAAIKECAEAADYHTISVWNSMSAEKEGALIQDLIGHMVDGIIFVGGVMSKPATIQRIMDQQIPVIMVERPMDIYGVDKILIDDVEGSTIAARELMEAGHRRMAYIGTQDGSLVCENRLAGFSSTLSQGGLQLNAASTCRTAGYQAEDGYFAMKALLSQSEKGEWPTACFIASDTLACGALQYLYEIGLRVPKDISIIGYNNSLSMLTSPPISTIAFPFADIGKAAIDLFLERKEGGRTSLKTLLLSPSYVDRGSVRRR